MFWLQQECYHPCNVTTSVPRATLPAMGLGAWQPIGCSGCLSWTIFSRIMFPWDGWWVGRRVCFSWLWAAGHAVTPPPLPDLPFSPSVPWRHVPWLSQDWIWLILYSLRIRCLRRAHVEDKPGAGGEGEERQGGAVWARPQPLQDTGLPAPAQTRTPLPAAPPCQWLWFLELSWTSFPSNVQSNGSVRAQALQMGQAWAKRPPEKMWCEHCSSVIDWEATSFASKISNKTDLEENFLNPRVSG